MLNVARILVPTDFSPNSLKALACAKEIARKFGSEVVVVHVVEPPVYPVTLDVGAVGAPDLSAEIDRYVEEQLARLVQEHARDVKLRPVRRRGAPFEQILAAAAAEKADLILIATHGYTGLKHVLLGSTAEKVIRKAACPVLVVRAEA